MSHLNWGAIAPVAGLALFWGGFGFGYYYRERERQHRQRLQTRRRRAELEKLWPKP